MSPPRTKATARPFGDQDGCETFSGRTIRSPVVGEKSASRPPPSAAIVGVVVGALTRAEAGPARPSNAITATATTPSAPQTLASASPLEVARMA